MTKQWWIPSDATCKKPSEHAAGSLLVLAPRSKNQLPWAVRYDDIQGGNKTPCLYFLNGSPLGPGDGSNIMSCNDAHLDELAAIGVGAPNFRVRIDFAPEDAISDNDMSWYDAKSHVVTGEFGIRLCGYDRYRPQNSQVWIDCLTWKTDETAGQLVSSRSSLVSAYCPTWRVVAEREGSTITVPFARPDQAPKLAP